MNKVIKKTGHVTQKQKQILVDFIEKRPEMYSGKFSATYTKQKSQQLWISLSNILNSIPGAPAKEWPQWRKTWTDIKKNTKAKLASNRREVVATGGGIPIVQPVDDLERKILQIMPPATITGDSRVPKPEINFSFGIEEHSNEEHSNRDNDQNTIIGEVEVQSEEIISIYRENDIDLKEHNYNKETEVEKDAQQENKVQKKFVSKSSRMKRSLENSSELIKTSQSRLTVEENYCSKKLALMERDINNREQFQIKQIEIGENLLKELKDIKGILLLK